MHLIKRSFLGSMIACTLVAGIPAHAGVIVNFREIGGDVIAAASGSLDLTGLIDDDTFFAQIGVRGDPAYFTLGAQGDGSSNAEGYNGITGPSQFGTGGLIAPTSSSGDIIGVNAFFFGDLFVNRGYVSARRSFRGPVSLGRASRRSALHPAPTCSAGQLTRSP